MKFFDKTVLTVLAGVAAIGLLTLSGGAAFSGQKPTAKKTTSAPPENPARFTITRANLAKSASFKVTQTLSPKGGSALKREYRVEVKGNKARLDYEDQAIGVVRYIANEKGVFFYLPGNKTAMKQTFKGGVEGALKVAFAQVSSQLEGAKKIGTATVSGQPTVMYKDPTNGSVVYLGTAPGFRLPVKTVLTNEGGTSTLVVTDIKLNIALPESRFALPTGTQIIESQDTPGGMPGLPGMPQE
jgi:outer membrane lipoprotein-sorting protein